MITPHAPLAPPTPHLLDECTAFSVSYNYLSEINANELNEYCRPIIQFSSLPKAHHFEAVPGRWWPLRLTLFWMGYDRSISPIRNTTWMKPWIGLSCCIPSEYKQTYKQSTSLRMYNAILWGILGWCSSQCPRSSHTRLSNHTQRQLQYRPMSIDICSLYRRMIRWSFQV